MKLPKIMPRVRRRLDQTTTVQGNSVELLAGGAVFYPAMLEAIADARREVLTATYLWESDTAGRRFVAALCRAARRGVRVHVLADDVGGRGLSVADRHALERAGAAFGLYHPVLYSGGRLFRRLHKKLLIIDGELAFTGGAGYADHWVQPPPLEWWDLMFALRGPVLAPLRRDFARDWRKVTSRSLISRSRPEPAGEEQLTVLVSRYGRPQLSRRLLRAVLGAEHRVDICAAYFVPGPRLRRALRRAAKRGVRVRLLLPGSRTDHFAVWSAGRRHYAKFLKRGVEIHEYTRSMLHAKYAVIDDRWAYMGSSNLDNWSLRFNAELDLSLEGGPALAALAERFEADLAHTRPIDAERWRDRPLGLRLAERVFGWFDPLL